MEMENNKRSDLNDNKDHVNVSSDDIYEAKPTSADDAEVLQSFRYRTFHCPRCRTDISVTKADVGKRVTCPDCDTEVVVPDYLDFDTETDYERQFFNKSKKERDEKYSPIRNPNRIGVSLNGNNVYTLRDPNDTSSSKVDEETYYPVRCRVCETLISVPGAMLGKSVVCPDCGTENVVTDALKRQQDALDVKFQPRDRGVYSIGEIPDQPMMVFQRQNGKTVIIDPTKKTIAPTFTSTGINSRDAGNPKDNETVIDATNYNSPSKEPFQHSRIGLFASKSRKHSPHLGLIERWNEKRRKILEEREDASKFLPPLVLRLKEGERVWALPSPPKRAPLFNKTFRAVFSEEIWTRGAFLFLMIGLLVCLTTLWIIPVTEKPLMRWDFETGLEKATLIGLFGVGIPAIFALATLLEIYFVSVYNAGNCGASRVVEWQTEDVFGYLGKGIWFLGMLLFSFAPGAIIAATCFNIEAVPLLKSAVFWGSFWALFPVFWLSTSQTDWLICPVSWSVFSSFFSKFHVWIQFYLFSFIFFYVPSVLWGAMAWDNVFFYVSPFVIVLAAMFYGLFLGRLSWILEDEIRNMEYDD